MLENGDFHNSTPERNNAPLCSVSHCRCFPIIRNDHICHHRLCLNLKYCIYANSFLLYFGPCFVCIDL